METAVKEQVTTEAIFSKLKEESEWFTIFRPTEASMQVFRKKKITNSGKEITWIHEESGKITCVLFDSSYKKLVKELGFQDIHPTFGGHYEGYITNDEREK